MNYIEMDIENSCTLSNHNVVILVPTYSYLPNKQACWCIHFENFLDLVHFILFYKKWTCTVLNKIKKCTHCCWPCLFFCPAHLLGTWEYTVHRVPIMSEQCTWNKHNMLNKNTMLVLVTIARDIQFYFIILRAQTVSRIWHPDKIFSWGK